ncbi:MAG TPA: LysR family transcriptional regulator [Stellaceae bacterium]
MDSRSGFTAAGRMLRIPKSTLSHRIKRLETEVRVRLLHRTSRRFGTTDTGEDCAHCRRSGRLARGANSTRPASSSITRGNGCCRV